MSISSYRVILILFSILLGFACASAHAAEGMLVITSSPGGAKIYIDGARKGTTPTQPGKDLALELEEGEYHLEAVLEGERTMKASETVFVPGGGIQPTHLVLLSDVAMVRIPAGSFKMGCVSGRGCNNNEKPVHTVRVRAFEIGKYEVTFAEWDACVADGGCKHRPDDEGWGRGKPAGDQRLLGRCAAIRHLVEPQDRPSLPLADPGSRVGIRRAGGHYNALLDRELYRHQPSQL